MSSRATAWSFDRYQRFLSQAGIALSRHPGRRYKYSIDVDGAEHQSNDLEEIATRGLSLARNLYDAEDPAHRQMLLRILGPLRALNRHRHGDRWTRANWWSTHRLARRKTRRGRVRRRRGRRKQSPR